MGDNSCIHACARSSKTFKTGPASLGVNQNCMKSAAQHSAVVRASQTKRLNLPLFFTEDLMFERSLRLPHFFEK